MFQTILVSIGTSLVVSLVTFILGLKSGKNQADRQQLQALYKRVYCHFRDIEAGIKENKPKEWSDYRKTETIYSTTKYIPLMKDLEQSGDILYLNKNIAKEALNLEKDSLIYSSKVNQMIAKIHEFIIANPTYFDGGITFDSYSNSKDTTRAKTKNNKNCNMCRNESYLLFLDEHQLKFILSKWHESVPPYALALITKGNPPHYSLTIYPNDMLIGTDEYVDAILSEFKDCDEYRCIINMKKELIQKIDKLNCVLQKRAKDPTNFWETFFGAFADLFK